MELLRIALSYWSEAVIVALTSAVAMLFRKYKATQNGVQALLRNAIIASFNKHMEKGYMPIYERENIQKMFEEYRKLGGNGTVLTLMEKLEGLPTREKGDHHL